MTILHGSSMVPASCGELIQGTIRGTTFLVSCPVNWFSRVTVRLGIGLQDAYPANRIKTYLGVRRMLDMKGLFEYGAVLEVSSSIPVGKGMASSTADLAAGCFAVAAALEAKPDPHEVAAIALAVEPSDAAFFPGIVLFDHVQGKLYEELGEALPLGIIALDFGGIVDTLEFNSRSNLSAWYGIHECEIGQALELVKDGIARKDPVLLGRGATLSALVNQGILPKPRLEELIDFVSRHGAYGVNVAHSGTVAGVLVPPGGEGDSSLVSSIIRHFPEVKAYYPLSLVEGGPRCLGRVWKKEEGNHAETPTWWKS